MSENVRKCPKQKNRLIVLAAACAFAGMALGEETKPIYLDSSQPVEARVSDLLSKLTPDEKIDMISGVNGFDVRPIERLNVPKLHMSDGPAGTRNDGPTTAYPAPVGIAASWDTDLANHFGESIGRNARARGVNFWLGPAMNIYRVPQNGRNFEYLGEDPYLAGRVATQIVKGVQSQGVAATIKHFATNNQETERMTISSEVDERALQEIYLPAFKACVTEGHAWAVMCAYNKLNGTYCSANDWLLNETLKKSWGFTGVVMSDWGAVHDTDGPLNAGLDLEMPSDKFFNKEAIQPLLDSGKVTQATIDDKCRRIIRVAVEMGAFDRPQKDESIPLDDPTTDATALQIAREACVLLKNENHTLPLDKTKVKTIAVVGPNADPAVSGGGGSSYTTPTHPVSVLAGLKAIAGEGVKVELVPSGYDRYFDDYVRDAKYVEPLTATFYKNRKLDGDPVATQTFDHIDFNWTDNPPAQMPKENYSARFRGQIDVKEAGKYVFVMESDDGSRAFIDDKPVLRMWRAHGKEKALKTIDLTAGKHDIRVEYFQEAKDAIFRFGWGKTAGVIDDDAKKQLASADAVVCCVGFNRDTESEGSDRTFELPYPQDELVQIAAAANPHTILVLNSGGNVDMNPWIDHVPALLQVWYPGQAGGTAIGEILFGQTNPSGHLPQSWEKRFEDNAAFGQVSYPGEADQVNYHEGIFVGYRHFDHDNIEPRFPFGYGLSYTSFDLKTLKVSESGESENVSVDVTNTGDREGAEVVQLYVGQSQCKTPRPVRELKQFARVDLKPGETKTVKMTLGRDAFSYYNMATHGWVVDPGEFEISVGRSSRDLPLKQTITVK
jgi:beta-glucosidase